MKSSIETWVYNKTGDGERAIVKVGDHVIDMYLNNGVFIVEEINNNGWVWGSTMKEPFYDGDKKNFIDYNIAWKYENIKNN